jgi:hypothetical protein
MPYEVYLLQKVAEFYAAAFSIIAIFSLLLAFKTTPVFLVLTFFSTLLVIFYSLLYRYKPKFKTVD